jgi:hypothetical protein
MQSGMPRKEFRASVCHIPSLPHQIFSFLSFHCFTPFTISFSSLSWPLIPYLSLFLFPVGLLALCDLFSLMVGCCFGVVICFQREIHVKVQIGIYFSFYFGSWWYDSWTKISFKLFFPIGGEMLNYSRLFQLSSYFRQAMVRPWLGHG